MAQGQRTRQHLTTSPADVRAGLHARALYVRRKLVTHRHLLNARGIALLMRAADVLELDARKGVTYRIGKRG